MKPIIAVNHGGIYSQLVHQLEITAASQFSRSPLVAGSILVNNSHELINKLNEINKQ